MTKVLADILLALDTGDLSMLTLLDLSAAFDTVDHQILICRMDTPPTISSTPFYLNKPLIHII